MAGRILIIGATGAVGSELVKLLIGSGEKLRAATRTPVAVGRISPGAAELIEFDFERPETFAPALYEVDRVFLISRPGDDQPEREAIPVIDEMKRQAVRHVVNLSAMGAETRDDFGLRKVELYLEASGIGFTHLRPNFFMQVFSSGSLLADICSSGAIHIPAGDARLSYVDLRDIAAVAATVLTTQGHAGKAYTITGGEALDHYAIAEAISDATSKTIQYVPINDETARSAISAAGLSPERVERLLGFYRLVRAGFCAPVSADVESVLGRQPITFQQFAIDNANCWA